MSEVLETDFSVYDYAVKSPFSNVLAYSPSVGPGYWNFKYENIIWGVPEEFRRAQFDTDNNIEGSPIEKDKLTLDSDNSALDKKDVKEEGGVELKRKNN